MNQLDLVLCDTGLSEDVLLNKDLRYLVVLQLSFRNPLLHELLLSGDVTKHRTGRTVHTGIKYRSWVLVKYVWCGAYYWFRFKKGTGYGFHAFLTCILLLLLLIQCKISLYLVPVQTVRCFVTPLSGTHYQTPSTRWLRYPSEAICLLHHARRRAHSIAEISVRRLAIIIQIQIQTSDRYGSWSKQQQVITATGQNGDTKTATKSRVKTATNSIMSDCVCVDLNAISVTVRPIVHLRHLKFHPW